MEKMISSAFPTDSELLRDWLENQNERAFHQLVSRYAGLVHTAAKRTAGDDAVASEVSQVVFILLARKAGSLGGRTSLAGWLHLTAVMEAKNQLRRIRREQRKRQLLHTNMDATTPHQPPAEWKEMQPVLDDALGALGEQDREALLLRFYRSLGIAEIAMTLGIAPNAARKRVERATERLRVKLSKRGCRIGGPLAVVLVGGFAADAQAAVPAASLLATKALAAGAAKVSAISGASLLTSITVMKASSMIPPVAAAIVAGAYLTSQQHAISSVERKSEVLGKQMAAAAADVQTVSVGSRTPKVQPAPRRKGAIDWKQVAESFAAMQRGGAMTDLKQFLKVQKHLQEISASEIVEILDGIGTLGLDPEARKMLESMLIDPLIEKDPKLALNRFIDRIHEDRGVLGFSLAKALAAWARKDPNAATSWFDEQIAAGKFESKALDGRNQPRIRFESALISAFLKTDPAASAKRLAQLPVEQRRGVFNEFDGPLNGTDQLAYATLVRGGLPAAEQVSALAQPTARIVHNGGYVKVAEYLERIAATPAERAAGVKQAGTSKLGALSQQRKLTAADVDSFREWVAGQSPESVDDATGGALGDSAHGHGSTSFADMKELAIRYHESSGNDQVLIRFLDSWAVRAHKEDARMLAGMISDPVRREEILKNIK